VTNVEKLTEVMDYMKTVPMEFERIEKEIKKNMDVYTVIEEFRF